MTLVDDPMVSVVVCERNAIYVDSTRVTNRATKWGVRATLASFECHRSEVVKQCLALGFVDNVRCIDTEPYLFAARAASATNPNPKHNDITRKEREDE